MLTVFVTYPYFLGLRTLTVIQNAEKLINRNGQVLNMDEIDYDDKQVLESLGTGRNDGVFQLESAGMKSFIKELKPQNLEDIIAGIALYRPGPMDFIPKYLKGKNNAANITYECEALRPILEPTYGCIVYQEQVMQIVRDLGGYSLGRSDLVRRAMSKKKGSVMEKERRNFVYGNPEEGVEGCINRGIPEKTANTIYEEMMDFAKYAFNKSHAAAYAVVTYQTAYLKYYYPVEFMAALLTSVIDFSTKVSEYVLTCRQMNIGILPPDINEGEWGFSVSGNNIRYGLSAIKSVGKGVIDGIVEEREENGPFTSLKDFIYRVANRELNKRIVENLIKAGALDNLPGTRKQKMMVYAELMDRKSKEQKNDYAGQMSLFDLVAPEEASQFEVPLPDVGEYDKDVLLAFEKEVLGIYISGHPMEACEDLWRKNVTAVSTDFYVDEETGQTQVQDGAWVTIGGMITNKTAKATKNKTMMAFFTVEDLAGSVEVIVFPQNYETYNPMLEIDKKVFVRGRVSTDVEKDAKLICDKIIPFDEIPRELWIQFADKETYDREESGLFQFLSASDGDSRVVIYLAKEKGMKRLPPSRNISLEDGILAELQKKYGQSNVKVVEKSIANLWKIH